MKILIATSEAVPYAKTGGLADVAGALLREFRNQRNVACTLIMPYYSAVRNRISPVETGRSVSIRMGYSTLVGRILASDRSKSPVAYFIDCPQLFDRPELYGTPVAEYPDNAVRFLFFCRAVLEACLELKLRPDIIHCHDWQTAMIPLYVRTLYRDRELFRHTRTVFTVHNLGYQGNFDPSALEYSGLGRDMFTPDGLEFYGRLNLMKAGLINADVLTTVSESYAQEILTPEQGFGLDGLLRSRPDRIHGILNGIDYDEWNPQKDPHLPSPYGRDDLSGKTTCKRALLKRCGMKETERPLLGIVSRFSYQKGLDLVAGAIDAIVGLGGILVMLGTGEEEYHRLLMQKAKRHKQNLFITIGFDDGLAHLIYAGSDFFLMPSRYEPCGLGQMIAMRFGSIPVARATGGLQDSISDYDHLSAKGTGILFRDYTASALIDAVKRSFCLYTDLASTAKVRQSCMSLDFSWSKTAKKYVALFTSAGRTGTT